MTIQQLQGLLKKVPGQPFAVVTLDARHYEQLVNQTSPGRLLQWRQAARDAGIGGEYQFLINDILAVR
jgi:hypothetical protein